MKHSATYISPRRAAFLIPTDRMGGAENVVRIAAAAAARSGLYDQIEIMVLSRSRSGTLDHLLDLECVELHYTEARSELLGLWKIVWLLARHRFSLVFSSSTHLNALTSFLRRCGLLRAKRVVARESTVIFDRSFGWRGFFIRSLYWFYGGHDMLVCQTDRMKHSLEARLGSRLKPCPVTIPNPVEQGSAAKQQSAGGATGAHLRIAWCGRLSLVKSPEVALQALSLLRARSSIQVRLFLIGEGPERQSLEALAAKLGLSDAVVFTGYVEDPRKIMSHCDIGLMTSAIEGFPNVVLEMLASGIRRIISTDCAGGLREVPAVQVLDSNDPEAFSRAILEERNPPPEEVVRKFLSRRSPEHFFQLLSGVTSGF